MLGKIAITAGIVSSVLLCAASYFDMESQSNTERLAIRFAPYVQELHDFLRSRKLPFGSPEDIGPLAKSLSSPGSFHDEMTSMLRSVIFRERGVVPRNELLELILIAMAGPEIDQSAQDIIVPVGVLYEFVGEVIHSLKKRSYVEEEETGIEKVDLVAASTTQPRRYSEQRGDEILDGYTLAALAQEAEGNNSPVRERHSPPKTLSDDFLRTQRSTPPFTRPNQGLDGSPWLPNPRVLEAVELAVVERAPLQVQPQHFFRNTMWALGLLLAAALLFRHWVPFPVLEAPGMAQGVAPGGLVPPIASGLVAQHADANDPRVSQGLVNRGGEQASDAAEESANTKAHSGSSQAAQVSSGNGGSPATEVQGAHQPFVPPPVAPSGSVRSNVAPLPGRRLRSPRPPQQIPVQPVAGPPPSGASKQGAFLVSSGVMDGNLIASPIPKYPRMASMAGVEGQVILQAVVSRNGTVVAAHVLEGHRLLRGAAVRAVKSWRYRPYVVRGKPTDIATIVIVDFHLPHS